MWSSKLNHKCSSALTGLILLGAVDQIHGNKVQAEISGLSAAEKSVILPLWMFPCDIREGDTFYFTKSDGIVELRCGDPAN